MKVIEPAHYYTVKNIESGTQNILFIRKEPDDEGVFQTVHDGTTNEELILVLIDRIDTLDKRMPSEFNKDALQNLRNALHALQARTADRENRKVEGTVAE